MCPIAVASTSLVSISYSSDKCLLQLQFRDGAVYGYFDVPLERYRELSRPIPKASTSTATSGTDFVFKKLHDRPE